MRKSIGACGDDRSGRIKKPDICQQSRSLNQTQKELCNEAGPICIRTGQIDQSNLNYRSASDTFVIDCLCYERTRKATNKWDDPKDRGDNL